MGNGQQDPDSHVLLDRFDPIASAAHTPVSEDSRACCGEVEYFRQQHQNYNPPQPRHLFGTNSKKRLPLPVLDDDPLDEYNEQHRRPRCGGLRNWHSGLESWVWELTGITFSILCFFALVAILYKIDGQLLSSWTITLSPNTVISVLSTASRAAMILPVAESISQLKWLHFERQSSGLNDLQLFDNASRGPAGALKFLLLYSARGKAFFMAYVGCITTIAAIALNPFAQQMLSYSQLPTQVDGVRSSVTQSHAYDYQQKALRGLPNKQGLRDPLLQQAAISGLYNLVAPPPFACPGSNCTYPVFASLGISGQCSDVTSRTSHNCIKLHKFQTQICNYTLPSGLQIGAFAGIEAHTGFYHTTINTTYAYSGTPLPEGTMLVQIGRVGIITFTSDDLHPDSVIEDTWQQTARALECSFDLVAMTYTNWTSTNGTVNEGSLSLSHLNLTTVHVVLVFNATAEKFPKTENRTFQVNDWDLSFIAMTIGDIFSYSDSFDHAAYQEALYNSADLPGTIDNIAKAMSYRMLSGPNATKVYGEVFALQTYVHVHWWWLTLSVVLLVAACAFFGTVMVQTQRVGQKAWKSSLDPLLYSDVPMYVPLQHSGNGERVRSLGGYEMIRKKAIVRQLFL